MTGEQERRGSSWKVTMTTGMLHGPGKGPGWERSRFSLGPVMESKGKVRNSDLRFMGSKRRKCQMEWGKAEGGEEMRSQSRENLHKMAIDFR